MRPLGVYYSVLGWGMQTSRRRKSICLGRQLREIENYYCGHWPGVDMPLEFLGLPPLIKKTLQRPIAFYANRANGVQCLASH